MTTTRELVRQGHRARKAAHSFRRDRVARIFGWFYWGFR